MPTDEMQVTDGGPNPDYSPRIDAIDAIASHLQDDDTAYEDWNEAERQAQRILQALIRRNLDICKLTAVPHPGDTISTAEGECVVVPAEPTDAMFRAGLEYKHSAPGVLWRAMLAALRDQRKEG